MKTRVALCILMSLLPGAAYAQQCLPTDTFEQCWQRFNPNPDPVPAAVQATVANMSETVSETNTGVPGMTMPTGTSLRDFLSVFSAAVQTATITESTNAVTLDWNAPMNVFDKVKFQAIFTDPTLSTGVTTALAGNAAALSMLEDEMTETDDVQASLTYAPENERFGRSVRQHQELIEALVASAIGDAEGRNLQALAGMGSMGLAANTPIGDRVSQVEALAKAEQQLATRHQQVVDAIAVLINNQPQVYGSAIYRYRDRLAGPSELSAKLTYESSANNLNRFLAKNRGRCGDAQAIRRQTAGLDDSTTCVGTLAALAKEPGGRTAAKASPRFAVSVEYKQSRANRFDLTVPDTTPAVVVPIATAGTHSLVYSITYGIPMATTMPGREGRFDIGVNYDNVSDDATRTDRLIATVTYTQKLTDTLALPLSLVYANHADYLPTSDKRLGVHFGLNYKLPNRNP